MFYFQKMTEKCDNEPEVSCWWRTSGFKLVTLRQLQLKTTTSIKSTLRMFSAAADGPHWQSRSRLSHGPGDLLYLSTSSSFGIHPHNSHHLGRLLLSAFLSLLPPFISFHPSLSLPQFVSSAGPPCLYLSLIFLPSSRPPLPGNFSQPPHPLIFHQGRSAQTNMGCNLSPAYPPSPTPHPTPVLPRPCLSVAQMHLFNTSSKQISGLLSATGRR